MTSEALDALRVQLREHEGWEREPYQDSVGVWTIGCGRNLEANPLTDDEIRYLLDNDIRRTLRACVEHLPWFEGLDEVRKRAVLDLAFNMGVRGLLTFRVACAALARRDYEAAADALVNSKWYRQVGRRGPRVVGMVRHGRDA